MAFIPSLSLRSSIKIPFCLYGKQKTLQTIPYVVDSCNGFVSSKEAEIAREIVNLLVPTPLAKHDKMSPRLLDALADKKRTRRRCPDKTKKIGYVTVPEASLDKRDDWEKGLFVASDESLWKSEGNDLHDRCLEWSSDGVGEELKGIPLIKPWTPEELDKIHGKYTSSEKKTMNAEKKKNKGRGKAVTLRKKKETATASLYDFNTFRVLLSEESFRKDTNSNNQDHHDLFTQSKSVPTPGKKSSEPDSLKGVHHVGNGPNVRTDSHRVLGKYTR